MCYCKGHCLQCGEWIGGRSGSDAVVMLGSFHSCQAKDDGGLDKCDNEDEEKNKFLRST